MKYSSGLVICYSIETRNHIPVKRYEFLSLKNIGKNITKDLDGK